MKIRPIYAIGSLLLVLILCGIGWHVFRPKNKAPVKIYKPVSSDPSVRETPQASQNAQSTRPVEERAARSKDVTLEVVRVLRGTETDPFIEKFKKIMETPEYEEYIRKQDDTFGVNLTAWWDFLESQGLGSGRILQERDFKALFPEGGDSSDYEPEMRKKIAELAVEYPFKDAAGLLSEFWEDKRNYIWTRQHFNGHVGDYDWAENIRQNASSILAELTEIEARETAPPPTSPDSISEPNLIEGGEENSGTQQARREVPPQREDLEPLPENADALETEIAKDLFADIPNFPSEADFQKSLREQFSPQRFNTALQTLSRYGPEEGLRRLKESDPEIATHVERLIQRNKETD